jgi:hypothetical protein
MAKDAPKEMERPKVNSEAQKELDKAEVRFEEYQNQLKKLDPFDRTKDVETEPQTKLSTKEAKYADALYIKPARSIASKEKFNEQYRKAWEHDWEYVKCVVENNEIVGEKIETWTKRYAGDPAHFWILPSNKPIYIPRLLAKQISQCKYVRYVAQDPRITGGGDGVSSGYFTDMVAETVKHRLDARPLSGAF